MSRLVSFVVLIAIIIVIGLLFYKVLVGFFIPVFLAAVLVVVFRPLHRWVLGKTGDRGRLAAALTTGLIVLSLVLPLGGIFGSAALQGLRLIEHNNSGVVKLRFEGMVKSLGLNMPSYIEELRAIAEPIDKIVEKTDDQQEENQALAQFGKKTVAAIELLRGRVVAEIGNDTFKEKWETPFDKLIAQANAIGKPPEDETDYPSKQAVRLKSEYSNLKTGLLGGPLMAIAREYANPTQEQVGDFTEKAVAYVQPRLLSITGATGGYIVRLVFGGIILIVATYFFLYDGPAMIQTVMRLSPLDDGYEQELLLEFDRISRAVVLATILSAITQGLTAGIGYYFAGTDFLVLLVLLTTVFAMVPFVGPAVVWVPVCLYLALHDERPMAACMLALWGISVVGTIDNFVKAYVLHGTSQLHPLLALLSVLGGVQTLGPVGIVVGPMIVAMLQTLLSILQRELLHFDKQPFVLGAEGAGPNASMAETPAPVKSSEAKGAPERPGDPKPAVRSKSKKRWKRR